MKKTGYILIAISLIIAAVTIAVLTSVTQITTMEADGYAVAGSANIKQALSKGEDVTQTLEAVHQDDTIYASALGYYVGTNRTPIDRNYPIYMNDGQTLRFLDDDQWLVSSDLKLLQTYNGLYLNDGYTYNRDLSQADGEEFLLLALSNGLYINAQKAVFTNSTGEREIPLNSICYFTDSYVRWYRYENGKLKYDREDSVGAATITLGSYEYTYEDFLRALDLIDEKIDGKGTPETTEAVTETTTPPTVSEEPSTKSQELPPETSGEDTTGDGVPETTVAGLEEEEIFYLGEIIDGERVKRTGLSEYGTGEGKSKDIPNGNRSAIRQDADDIADADREDTKAGGDIPDTDKHSSSGRTTPGSSSSGGGTEPAWKKPEISVTGYKTWMYALDATLNYTDTVNALTTSVTVSVYSKISKDSTEPVEIKTDEEGHKVYPYAADLTAYYAEAKDLLGKTSLIGSQEFAISPLEPGATVYVQYTYEYKQKNAQTATKVASDFTEIKLDDFDASKLTPVLSTWSLKEAEYARKFVFHDFVLANETVKTAAVATASDKQKTTDTFDFEEFKKDSLPYLCHMTVELYNETTGKSLTMNLNDTYVKVAKKKAADYTSRAELTPGCVYKYRVYAKDDYGNVFPLKIQTEDMPAAQPYTEFEGTLYTRKEAPGISVRFDDLTSDRAEVSIVILDEQDVMVASEGLQVYLKDKDGKALKMSGTLRQVIDEKKGVYGKEITFTDTDVVNIPLTSGEVQNAQFKLVLTGLSTFTNYIMRLDGTYNPNLTVDGHQTSLADVKETLVSQSFWTARDSKDYNTPTAILEGVEAVSSTKITGTLWMIDDMDVMPSGAIVTVYDNVRKLEKTSADEPRGAAVVTGKTGTEKSYDKTEYSGAHILNRSSVTADGQVDLGDLVPGSKAYVQLSYNVIYLENGHQKNATVQSNLLEVTVPDAEYSLNTITVSWDEGFATGERSISLKNIKFTEDTSVKAPVSGLEKLLDYLEVTLTPAAAAGDPVVIRLASDVIDRAKQSSVDYDSGNLKTLSPDTVYTYSVRGYRADGTELPLKINAGGRGAVDAGATVGYLYTCKQEPAVKVGMSQNAFGKINLELYCEDPNSALLLDRDIVFRLYEVTKVDAETTVETQVSFSGKLDDVAFTDKTELVLGTDLTHTLELSGLTIGKKYRISVKGDYCLQPTDRSGDTANRLPEVKEAELVLKGQNSFTSERGTTPVVTMTGLEPWIYAVGAKLDVDDPSGTITDDGVIILATDENGKELYKQKYSGSQEFAVSPLEPGSKVFISYSYEYVDPATQEKIAVSGDPVYVELLPLEGSELDELRGCWDEAFATSDSAVTFDRIKFYNSSDYEAEPEEFSFENFKKNVLAYLNSVDVEFTPVGEGERVKVTMTSGIVSWAKMEETDESDISLTTKTGLMLSNKKYTYKINAKDLYGNTIPMKVAVNDGKFYDQTKFSGVVYTAKKAPTVKITEVENLIGSMKLHVEVEDTDESLVDGTALVFSIRDKDGVIQLAGDIAGQVIDSTNFGPTSFKLSGSTSYDITVNNLELGFHYTAQVRGSYDPQPDAKPREEGYDLPLSENSLLGKKNFIASDGDLAIPGKTGEEGADPEKLEKGTFVGYIEPSVTMGDLEPWVYAVGSSMTIYDPTAAIESGVTVSVFGSIQGTGKSTPNAKGQRVYEGVDDNGSTINQGVDTLLRVNRREGGELALGTIRPGSTVYVQYSYSYYETKIRILVDSVTRKKTVDTNQRTRKTYYSNITQVKLLTIKDGGMASISGSWTGDFATYPDTFSLSAVSFKNSSSYDPDPKTFTFDNYKKNTVGYLNDVQLTLKKLDSAGKETGSAITVSMSSSTVSQAISSTAGIPFSAASGLLEPDSVYSYTVKGLDIYGQELPMTVQADGASSGESTATFCGKLYTRKDIPDAIQTVQENTSGVITLKITADDKWKSLEAGSMVLSIYDAQTMSQKMILGGTINGVAIPEGTTDLALTGSSGEEYTVVLNTLDFYAGYGARVTGTYDPQPTNAPEGKKLEKESGVTFSEMFFQTSEMAGGTVYFGISTENMTCNSGTVKVSMTNSSRYPTAQAPVSIINRIHFKVTAKTGSVMEFDVNRSELEAMKFEDRTARDYEITSLTTIDRKIYVSGAPRTIEAGVTDENLWQGIMARWDSQGNFVSPLPLKIEFTEGALTSMTEYTVEITPYCDRPNSVGREVRSGLSTSNKFTTLKKDPVLEKDELLIAGPSVQLIGAYVLDTDSAINGSMANITLTDTTTGSIVAADTVAVHKTRPTGSLKEGEYTDLVYSDLVAGHTYVLEVYTTAYDNTVEGSTPRRFQISAVSFTAGSLFEGELNLQSLEYDTKSAGRKTLLSVSTAECLALKEAKDSFFIYTSDTGNAYQTKLISLAQDPDGNPITINAEQTIAITANMPLPVLGGGWYQIYYYNSAKSYIGSSYQTDYAGGSTWIAPSNAAYYQIRMSSNCSFEEIGLDLSYTVAKKLQYTDSTDEDWKARKTSHYHSRINATTGKAYTAEEDAGVGDWSAIYMVASEPGASYVFRTYQSCNNGDIFTATMFFYNEEKKLISTRSMNASTNYIVTAPADTAYMSMEWSGYSSSTYGLYRIGEGTPVSAGSYKATVNVKLKDLENYLYALKARGAGAWLKVEKMDSIRKTERGEQYQTVENIPIEFEEGGFTYDADKVLSGLASDTQWKVSLIAKCKIGGTDDDPKFTEVLLDTISFQTDAEYELIHNRNEMKKLRRNADGNYLVVNDFVNNSSAASVSFRGTLDFQGHVVTCGAGTNFSYIVDTLKPGGIIRNLVVEYPESLTETSVRPIVCYNYGTMDNIVIRTTGEFHKKAEVWATQFLIYYNYGTVSNFIFEMGGDLVLERMLGGSSGTYNSVLIYQNLGTLENWYMYGANNSKLVVGNLPKESESLTEDSLSTGLIRNQLGFVRNGFTSFETKIYTPAYVGTTNFYMFYNSSYFDNMYNYYHVGDFTAVDTLGKESTSTLDRLLSSTAGKTRNFWHLTDVDYETGTTGVSYSKKANVRNTDWQKAALADGFDITENMQLGYYPRLRMNTCMQKYQPYIPLNTVIDDSSRPSFMNSELLYYITSPDPEMLSEQFSAGQIRLYFKNQSYDKITDVSISGLVVDSIQRQEMVGTLWEVDVNVHLDPTLVAKGTQGYFSSYTLESIYTKSSGSVPVPVNRKLENVKFYKTVQGINDWIDINKHMNWNYRLINDLNFGKAGVSGAGARIFGTNLNSQKAFTGTIDGNGHTISNLVLEDGLNANIIYSLSGGTVTNLTVDGLTLSLNRYPTQSRIGFIGYAYGAVIDDVHVMNSTFAGFGNYGAVVGFMDAYCRMTNCTGINNRLTDVKTDTETFAGGLCGYAYCSMIASCYVRDVYIHPELCTNIHGVGGIVGRLQASSIQDCYSTGSITGTGYNVGGIIGNFIDDQFCHYDSLWSRVTIDMDGDFMGGIAGRTNGSGTGLLALGDIYADGSHVHRVSGYSKNSNITARQAAYSGQKVTGLTSLDKDDSYKLATSADLADWSFWADSVLLDDSWDLKTCWNVQKGEYDKLTYFPKVYKYSEEEEDASAQEGYTVNIDFDGRVDGAGFSGGTAEGYDLVIGSGKMIDGFETGLIGHKAGETVILKLTFPEDYSVAELAGKAVEYEVKINRVREPVRYQTGDEGNIFLPGQGGEYVLTVTKADYTDKSGTLVIGDRSYDYKELYIAEMTLEHPGVTFEQFKKYYEDCAAGVGGKTATDVINIEGMDMSDPNQTVVTLSKVSGNENATRIIINNFTNDTSDPVYTKALDLYRLTVRYTDLSQLIDENLIADLVYKDAEGNQKINYWKIGDLGDWRNVIGLKDHGKTKENFLITGEVDFANGYGVQTAAEEAEDVYRNLQINRLEGSVNDKGEVIGTIKNLYYTTNAEADPWIASVTGELCNLKLEDCTGDLSQIKTLTTETQTIAKVKNRNGVIFSVRDVKGCIFDGIRTIVGTKTYGNSAFIMIGYGSVEDTTIKNLYYDTSELAISDYEYAAGFMCWVQGSVKNNTAEQIHVVAPKARYVGGIFCMINGSKWASQSAITEVEISGNKIYGGTTEGNAGNPETTDDDIPAGDSIVKGYRYAGYLASHIYEVVKDNTIGRYSDTLYVEAVSSAGGISYYMTTYVLSTRPNNGDSAIYNNKLINIHVTTTGSGGYTGGMVAYLSNGDNWNRYSAGNGNTADGITVTSAGGYTGGLYGYIHYDQNVVNSTVVNSTIQTVTPDGKEGASVGTGGIVGYMTSYIRLYGCVVRNTTVSGPRNVGGILGLGSQYKTYPITYCYVAEDVKVIGTDTDESNVGGIVGYAKTCRMSYCACGASVTAAGKNAGGLIGYLYQYYEDAPVISQCYFIGNVTAADYAGGIIGYNMNNVAYTVKVGSTTETRYQTSRFLYNGNKTATSYKDRGYMYGIFVGGTFTTTGTAGSDGKPAGGSVHVSYAFNNEKNTDTDEIGGDNPKIYVWDQTVLNGVTVDTAKQPFQSDLVASPESKWLSASAFREKSYYENTTGAGFGTTYMDYSSELGVLTEYMPYVKYATTAADAVVMPYEAYKSYDSTGVGIERGGIKLPDYGANPDAIQVYASSVSTVNIEVTEHEPVSREDDWTQDYTPVEYIESVAGKSYIKTDYDGNDVDLLVDCKFTELSSVWRYLYGQKRNSGGMLFNTLYYKYYVQYNWKNIYFTPATTIDMKQSFTDDGKTTIEINGKTYKAARATTNDSQMNMLLFACYNTDSNVLYYTGAARCYSFRLHLGNSGDTIMDLYPCIRKTDGKAGMFDKIGKKFYPSAGSADFIAGPAVTDPVNSSSTLSRTGITTKKVYVKFTAEDGTVTEKTYDLNDRGTVTVDYDFTSKISVSTDGKNYADYTANELRRSVSLTERENGTKADIWYYLNTTDEDERQISYGTVTESRTEPEYTLPDEYTPVEYIKAEANQYINTGVYGEAKVEYKIMFTPYKTSRQLQGWWGSYDSYWGIRNGTSELGGQFENGGTVSSVRASLTDPDTVVWDYRVGGSNILTVNGTQIVSKTSSVTSLNVYQLQLFALTGSYRNYASMYECKVWQKGKLVRWFVPVVYNYGKSDAVAGMYDLTEGKFYKSATSTKFKAGAYDPVAKETKEFTGTDKDSPIAKATLEALIPKVEKEIVTSGTVNTANIGDPIHVWGNQVLMRDGNEYAAYTLSPGTGTTVTVSLTSPKTVENGKAHAEASPFLTQTVTVESGGSSVTVSADVYKNYTVLGTSPETVVSARMYVEGSIAYTVTPWENQLYDKVVMKDSGTKKYVAVLSPEGGLTASFDYDDLYTSGIREISNSFTSSSPYIVVLYSSGALRVVNYETGKLLFNTEENAGFLSYVTNVLNAMTSSVTKSGTTSGGSTGEGGEGRTGVTTQIGYTVMGAEGLKVTGVMSPATGLTAVAAGSGTAAGNNTESGTDEAAASAEGADASGSGSISGTANSAVSGQPVLSGTAAGNGTVSTDSAGAVAGQSGTEEKKETEEKATGTTEGEGQEVSEKKILTASAVYVPGQGVLDTKGNVIIPAEKTEYVPGEGVYADGELVYEESLYAGDEELTEETVTEVLTAAAAKQAEETEETEETAEGSDGETAEDGQSGEETAADEEAEDTGETGEELTGAENAEVKTSGPKVTRSAEEDGEDKTPADTEETEDPEGQEEETEEAAEASGKQKRNGTSEAAGTHSSGESGAVGAKTGGTGGTASGGTAAGGENTGEQTDAQNPGGEGGSDSSGAVLLVTGTEKQKQIAQAIGQNITVMNTVTGRLQDADTEVLFDGDVMSSSEKAAKEAAEAEMLERIENEKAGIEVAEAADSEIPEEAVIAAGGAYAVSAGLGRTLGEEESSGFMLIGLMILLAVIIFAVIYFAVIRRKRLMPGRKNGRGSEETQNSGNSGEEER